MFVVVKNLGNNRYEKVFETSYYAKAMSVKDRFEKNSLSVYDIIVTQTPMSATVHLCYEDVKTVDNDECVDALELALLNLFIASNSINKLTDAKHYEVLKEISEKARALTLSI